MKANQGWDSLVGAVRFDQKIEVVRAVDAVRCGFHNLVCFIFNGISAKVILLSEDVAKAVK